MDELTTAALGPRRASEVFGFVNLDEDRDRVVRRGRLWFRDRSGQERPSWAARAARGLGADRSRTHGSLRSFWIDTRIDWPGSARISWRQVPAALDRTPELFRDRLVLLGGGDIRGSGDDYHPIVHRSGRNTAVSALTLQAMIVDTIGAGLPVREPGRAPVLAAAALAAALVIAVLLSARRIVRMALGLAAGMAACLALTFPVFWWTGLILPVTAPLVLVLLGAVLALTLRRLLPSPPEASMS
jgi:CHASE2 domain-containing sensor protein